MEEIANYRKQIMEMLIKLNEKDRLNLGIRNIVLEKQIRIEQLEQELHEMKKKEVEMLQEFLNKKIKSNETIIEKKECGECRREDRRMYSTPNYKCENDFCCNYK
jgi:uncharacterized protein Smg (DUF494 family)